MIFLLLCVFHQDLTLKLCEVLSSAAGYSPPPSNDPPPSPSSPPSLPPLPPTTTDTSTRHSQTARDGFEIVEHSDLNMSQKIQPPKVLYCLTVPLYLRNPLLYCSYNVQCMGHSFLTERLNFQSKLFYKRAVSESLREQFRRVNFCTREMERIVWRACASSSIFRVCFARI